MRARGLTNAALPEVEATVAISQRMLNRSGEVRETLVADDLRSTSGFGNQQARAQNGSCGKVRECLTGSSAVITYHRAT